MSFTETFPTDIWKSQAIQAKWKLNIAIVRPDSDHTGVEQLENNTRTMMKMALPLSFCALDSKATFQ